MDRELQLVQGAPLKMQWSVEMKRRMFWGSTFAAICLLTSSSLFGQGVAGAVAPPASPTLWSFLGIPQGAQKVQGALFNRRGNTPRLEPDTPMRALNDPRNLFSKVPAIKKAAEIKQAEDLKPQKIKSIKYLTSIGCGCYDKDGSVTDALVAAMEDCTEEVRLATLQAVKESAENKCCNNCGQVCCCNEKLMTKLAEIAYERDDTGCYKEPSARVREAAAAALRSCCPGGPPPIIESMIPEEEKKEEKKEIVPETNAEEKKSIAPEGAGNDAEAKAPADAKEKVEEKKPELDKPAADDAEEPIAIRLSDRNSDVAEVMSRDVHVAKLLPTPTASESSVRPNIAQMRALMQSSKRPALATPNPEGGIVMSHEPNSKTVYVHFESQDLELPNGCEVHLRQDPAYGTGFHGMWHVVESLPGCAILAPVGQDHIEEAMTGDHVVLGPPPVLVAPVSYNE